MSRQLETIHAARHLISDEMLVAFFRAALRAMSVEHLPKNLAWLGNPNDVTAIKVINSELEEGFSLDEVFDNDKSDSYTLSVNKISVSDFEIHFGCVAGPLCGDGGSWKASFVDRQVRSIAGGRTWVS